MMPKKKTKKKTKKVAMSELNPNRIRILCHLATAEAESRGVPVPIAFTLHLADGEDIAALEGVGMIERSGELNQLTDHGRWAVGTMVEAAKDLWFKG